MHRLLTRDLATTYQDHLGIRTGGRAVTVRQLRYLLSQIARRLNPDVRPGKGDTVEDVTLDRIANLILAASTPAHLPAPSTCAMDSTAVHSWARGTRRRTDPDDPGMDVGVSVDDAAWGYCTKTQDNRSNQVFGYALFTAAGVPDVDARRDATPILTRQMLLRPANTDVAAPGLALLDDLHAGGAPVRQVLCDRAARADYDQRCGELEAFTAAIAERQTYAFRRVQGPDPTGKERWECPAQAGKIACERCPLSLLGPTDLPAVDDPPAPATAPACCTQRTITITGDVLAKLRQRLAWGTPEWIRSFARRTYVEGAYGNLKSAKTENIRRGWCFVWGRAKTTLLLAVAIAASNIRILCAWSQRTGDITDPLTTPDPEGHGFEEVDADGNPLGPTGPPGAAAA